MLIKKKLLQIEPQPCPDLRGFKTRDRYDGKDYAAAVQVVDGVVIVDAYKKDKELVERFFADGKTWQFYDVTTESWNQRTNSEWGYNHNHYYCKEIPKDIFEILQTPSYRRSCIKELGGVIAEYTTSITSRKRYEAQERKFKRIQEIKNESIYKPKGLNRWCLLNVFPACSMILPKGKKNVYTVKCLSCDHEFEVATPKHKGTLKCPHCKRMTTSYRKQYISTFSHMEDIVIFKKIKGGFAAVGSKVQRYFDSEGNQRLLVYHKSIFHYKEGRTTELYDYNGFNNARYGLDGHFSIYTPTVKKVFPDGKIDGIDIMRMKGKEVPIFRILEKRSWENTKHLCNLGMYNLAAELDQVTNLKTFADATGIDQNYISIFRKRNYGMKMAAIISEITKLYKKKGTYNSEQLLKIESFTKHGIETACEYMTDAKFINYFYKQCQMYPKIPFSTITGWYDDYMKGLMFLIDEGSDIDMTKTIIRYPRDIKKAHDIVMDKQRLVINKAGDEKIAKLARKYSEVKIRDGNLMVVHPTCINDFISEGTNLQHCVGSNKVYYDKQVTGEYMTFFIRKKKEPGKPYYTATFKVGKQGVTLKECHGLAHKSPTEEIKKFLDKYLKAVIESLNIEEKASNKERSAA